MTWAEFQPRVKRAIEQNLQHKVVYDDILGEGAGRWDSQPRYPLGVVNCIVWLRKVIAESYSDSNEERQVIMDRLRYYRGFPGFSTRKHFTSRWMRLDPMPLVRVRASQCDRSNHRVKLNIKKFRRFQSFGCPLYYEDTDYLSIDYVESDDLVDCMEELPPSVYVLFAVASEGYNRVFGKKTGALGLVHGLFWDHGRAKSKIYHASITTKKVEVEDAVAYFRRMEEKRHLGYQLYRLDPNWEFMSGSTENEELKSVLRCEKTLPPRLAAR